MEIDSEVSKKLLLAFVGVNILSAALGLTAFYLLGPIPGIIVFTLAIIILPLLTQYLMMKKT